MSKHSDKLILVTGATGKQGGAVLHHLRERGFPVRVLVRDPDSPKARTLAGPGTEIVRGDLNDPASLRRAVEDVYGVYSVQTSLDIGSDAEVRQGINLAEAARLAAVSHFVYSSVGAADQKTGIPHFESKARIEEHIQVVGVPWTIVRPVYFMENWLNSQDSISKGTLAQPLKPETRLAMIAVDDIGAFVALAFEHPGRWKNRAVDIAGDDLSMSETAEAFSRFTEREVGYVQVPWEQFEQRAGHEITLMYKWFEAVGYHVDIPALREDNSRLLNFNSWLQKAWPRT